VGPLSLGEGAELEEALVAALGQLTAKVVTELSDDAFADDSNGAVHCRRFQGEDGPDAMAAVTLAHFEARHEERSPRHLGRDGLPKCFPGKAEADEL